MENALLGMAICMAFILEAEYLHPSTQCYVMSGSDAGKECGEHIFILMQILEQCEECKTPCHDNFLNFENMFNIVKTGVKHDCLLSQFIFSLAIHIIISNPRLCRRISPLEHNHRQVGPMPLQRKTEGLTRNA